VAPIRTEQVVPEQVVIVDADDTPTGLMDKLAAHRHGGALHRAVSACLVDDQGRVLLQRRAIEKYHFAGRWSNACCTHPRPGETPEAAIVRRLGEELGVKPTGLAPAGTVLYRAIDASSGLVEHELDHVFVGLAGDALAPDPTEVMDWRYVDPAKTTDWSAPEFTPWLAGVLRVAGLAR
jgi:isopentenyl-diphosphate delta-isomerase